jgi:hypothetical protein
MTALKRLVIAAALTVAAGGARATYHTYQIDELYSNADGSVQYVVLHEALGMNGQNLLAGHTLTATHGAVTKSYVFAINLPGGACDYYSCMSSPTANTRVLIATDGFAALGLVTPDYVVPNGFLPIDGGTVNYAGVDQWTYSSLPTDGTSALWRDGTTRSNVARNYSGDFASLALAAPNYQGLWWAAGGNESGWGINFAHQRDQVFATWYTYDAAGNAWWLSMLATRTAGTTYAGPIYVDSGPPFNAFVGAAAPSQVGTGTLSFVDANNASFSYTVNGIAQMKALARYDLGTGPQPTCAYSATKPDYAAATNYQDLWWAASGAESGWGINFAHQGDSLFATWYTYDVDGTPLWLSALLARSSGTTYSGNLLRTSGPRFDAYRSSDLQPAQNVGTATVTFASGASATFSYTVNGIAAGPVTQAKTIARFPFAPDGGTVCR